MAVTSEDILKATKKVTSKWTKQRIAEERTANRRAYRRMTFFPVDRVTLRDAVFEEMADAITKASGGGVYEFPQRNLFYAIRPLVQEHTKDVLNYAYFSSLLTDYEQEHGVIVGLYRDARGYLYEPHTGKTVPLGTREVNAYEMPKWQFDKVLYIEKKGLWPIIEHAKLAERYDMAVACSEGFATRAARELLARAEGQQMTIFALHDADPGGYEIARTLREATRTMPDHDIEVIDFGILLQEAIEELELQSEEFYSKKSMPAGLAWRLTEFERDHWPKVRGTGVRVELNAFSPEGLIDYIEGQLKSHKFAKKLVPPKKDIDAELKKQRSELLTQAAKDAAEELIDLDDMAKDVGEDFASRVDVVKVNKAVGPWAKKLEPQGWRGFTEARLQEQVDDLDDEISAVMAEKLRDAAEHLP